MHLKPYDGRAAKASKEKKTTVPRAIEKAATEHGWEVFSISKFWTRLKKDNISIEFRYDLRRETRGRAYRNEVVLVAIFDGQREIIEYMAQS